MKYVLISLIYFYKQIPGDFHNRCNFTPTCSTYAIDCLISFSTFKALFLICKRLIKCNPFHKFSYDPISKGELE